MPTLEFMLRWSVLVGAAMGLLVAPAFGATTRAIPEQATLDWRGRILHPEHVVSPALPTFRAGPHLLILREAQVTAVDPVSREVRWQVVAPEPAPLVFLGWNGNVAYLVPRDRNANDTTTLADPRVRCLDLSKGSWRPDLVVPHGRNPELILGVASDDNLLVVVGATLVKSEKWPHDTSMAEYRVTGFDSETARKKWSRSFVAAPEPGSPPAYLLAARRPNETIPGIRYASMMDHNVLVCAGAGQDIICLDAKSGEVVWSKSHLWEFERGFIGPSVWSHYIARFGDERLMFGKDELDPAARVEFEKHWTGEIVGGPIIVPNSADKPGMGGRYRIFVAVSRAPVGPWASRLGQCVVYELDGEGEIWTLGTLPRMVVGSEAEIDTDVVDWVLQNNAQARLRVATERAGSMPGSFDLVTKVAWYREYDALEPNAWLTLDKPIDPAAFSASRTFRVQTGGYVIQARDDVFHLPLVAIDRSSGTEETLTLHVPLIGTVPLPEQNIGTKSDDGPHHTWGSYFLGITRLRCDGERLAITIGMENGTAELTFDLGVED